MSEFHEGAKLFGCHLYGWQRANARNISFETLGGQLTLTTQFIKPKLTCYIPPPTQHHSFYRNLPPFATIIISLFGWFPRDHVDLNAGNSNTLYHSTWRHTDNSSLKVDDPCRHFTSTKYIIPICEKIITLKDYLWWSNDDLGHQ